MFIIGETWDGKKCPDFSDWKIRNNSTIDILVKLKLIGDTFGTKESVPITN